MAELSQSPPLTPTQLHDWFDLGNSHLHLSAHVHPTHQLKPAQVILKQPTKGRHALHPQPVSYTSIAQLKRPQRSDSVEQDTLFSGKQNEGFQNYYRQKLVSSKSLFQASKLRQLDMLDTLQFRLQPTPGQLNQDQAMRLFNVCTRDGQPILKVVEESDDLCNYLCRSSTDIRLFDLEQNLLLHCSKQSRPLREHRAWFQIRLHPPDLPPIQLGQLRSSSPDRYELFDSLFTDRPIFVFDNPSPECCCDPKAGRGGCCCSVRTCCSGCGCCGARKPAKPTAVKLPGADGCSGARCNARLSQLRISAQPQHGPFSDLQRGAAFQVNSNNRDWTGDARNPLLLDSNGSIAPGQSGRLASSGSVLCTAFERCFAGCGLRCAPVRRHRWTVSACKLQLQQQIGCLMRAPQRKTSMPSADAAAGASTRSELQLPINLELRHKVLLLAASLHLNYIHFT